MKKKQREIIAQSKTSRQDRQWQDRRSLHESTMAQRFNAEANRYYDGSESRGNVFRPCGDLTHLYHFGPSIEMLGYRRPRSLRSIRAEIEISPAFNAG